MKTKDFYEFSTFVKTVKNVKIKCEDFILSVKISKSTLTPRNALLFLPLGLSNTAHLPVQ